MPRTVAMLAALAALHMCSARSPLPRRRPAPRWRPRACALPPYAQRTCCPASGGCTCPAHAPVGHRARVGRARAVGVDRGHPVEHAHRGFPRRHARHGAHGRDRHAHGAVLAAARAAQGRPPALPCPARSPPSTASCEAPKAARCASSSRGRRETGGVVTRARTPPEKRAHHRASRRGARSEGAARLPALRISRE